MYMNGGGGEVKKKKKIENVKKKKLQSALFSPPGRWTGNHFLFKGGLTEFDLI